MKINIPTPDDWHLHLRDGENLTYTAPWTARHFARAIVMPNLRPPVLNGSQALSYSQRIKVATQGTAFEPLMTLYLTDATTAAVIEDAFTSESVVAVKYYPAHATTNSEAGVTSLEGLLRHCETLAKIDRPLLVHGEVTRKEVDIFDREKAFIDDYLAPILKRFPHLRIVFEHITTLEAVDFVKAHSNVAATITPHHLVFNRNAMFQGGLRPHKYCLPVAKREQHRLALVKAATSGDKSFFLGTDSAPHSIEAKESDCGCAGLFNAPSALATYAEVFYQANALDKLAAFASLNGPAFYRMKANSEQTELVRSEEPLTLEDTVPLSPSSKVKVFTPDGGIFWKITRLRGV